MCAAITSTADSAIDLNNNSKIVSADSVAAVNDIVVPSAIELDRTSHLRLEWPDGLSATWEIDDLRLACPCAGCRSRREQGLRSVPPSSQPIAATDATFVGSYALGITWADGVCSSIYAFEMLRRWAVNASTGTPSFQAAAADRRAAGLPEADPADATAAATPVDELPDSGSFS